MAQLPGSAMSFISLAYFALMVSLTIGHASGDIVRVVELTDDNFDETVKDGVWMVDIYAPWCSHCRQLEPIWKKLAEETSEHGIQVAKIDGSKEKVLMRRFGATAFPSIYLMRDQQTWDYQVARTVQAVAWPPSANLLHRSKEDHGSHDAQSVGPVS
eukprot:gene11106-18723_t